MTRNAILILLVGLLGGSLARAAEKKPPAPFPPVEVRQGGGEWGWTTFAWEGALVVADPVNKETLYLCGRDGGAEFGSIGCWALAEDGKTWRKLEFPVDEATKLADRCRELERPIRDGMNAARVLRYSADAPDARAKAVKEGPAKALADALVKLDALAKELAGANEEYAGPGASRAANLVASADAALKQAVDALAKGEVTPEALASCFAAAWNLDEAADFLASGPPPRYGAAAAFDPEHKCVVLFGGSHGDYVRADTWIYDCATKAWRQVLGDKAPAPRMGAKLTWDDQKKALVLTGGQTVLHKMVYQKGYTDLPKDEWTFDAAGGVWTPVDDAAKKQAESAAALRTYRTVCPAYDPRWYDGAPAPDPAATAEWLGKLKPNAWTEVPLQARPAPERDWGTAAYSPDHDQIFRWTGGHQADPGNNMSTYFPAVDRWAIGYIPEIYGKGMSFAGRPDCMNHTYLHYDYDPVSRRLVCTSQGGTGVYDPARMDWDYTIAQPFCQHVYETCTVGTPIGVVVISRGYFGVMDVAKREWRKLPIKGKVTGTTTDGTAVCYDSKRDCIWVANFANYQKPSGNIWKYDMKTTEATGLTPANADSIAKAKGFNGDIRESVYVPEFDLVLFNNFVGGRQAAYDPAGNRWVLTNIGNPAPKDLGGVGIGLIRDKRGLLWAMSHYKRIFVLKPDAATLEVTTEVPAAPAPAKS